MHGSAPVAPQLADTALPHLIPGGDYVFTGDGTDDCDGHGTIVAGIIGATETSSGRTRFSGVAQEATIIGIRQSSVKFAPAGQSAPGFGDVDTLAMAVRTAADMGASVINVSSIACVAAAAGLDDRALGAALAYAVDVKNVVVVAAAGNVGGLGQCPDQNPPADPTRPGRPYSLSRSRPCAGAPTGEEPGRPSADLDPNSGLFSTGRP